MWFWKELYSGHALICNILWISVGACSMITLTFVTHATSPFCNRLFIFISIYWEALYEGKIMCSSYWDLCIYFLNRTRKEVCIETHEVVSFHHLWVKLMTLQVQKFSEIILKYPEDDLCSVFLTDNTELYTLPSLYMLWTLIWMDYDHA